MYPNLKLAIFKQGIHQNRLARELGINEFVLSKIIHGYREPSETVRRLLASYLRVDELWLFEKYEVNAPVRRTNGRESGPERENGES
jgi:transcriptional regulator with XRE-family HTH domain